MSDPTASVPAVIDARHLAHQREWSHETFGPGERTKGVLDHIRKELREVEQDPDDLSEWVDVIILAFDGALRAGHDPQPIIDAIKAKQARNESRTWPDWRTADPDKAIEHVRPFVVTHGDLDPSAAQAIADAAVRHRRPAMPDRTHYRPGDRHRGYPLGGGSVKPAPPKVSLHPAAHEAYHVCVDDRHYLNADCALAVKGRGDHAPSCRNGCCDALPLVCTACSQPWPCDGAVR